MAVVGARSGDDGDFAFHSICYFILSLGADERALAALRNNSLGSYSGTMSLPARPQAGVQIAALHAVEGVAQSSHQIRQRRLPRPRTLLNSRIAARLDRFAGKNHLFVKFFSAEKIR